MPKIVGQKVKVVDTGRFHIVEYAGNVATKDDTLSVAHVTVDQAPTQEPWLTIQYDEWLCVLQGCIELHYYHVSNQNDNNNNENNNHNENNNNNISVLTVQAGETALISKGERFRPVFPQAGTIYVPVCQPAFRLDRCARGVEEGDAQEAVVKQAAKDIAKDGVAVAATTTTTRTNATKAEEQQEVLPPPTVVYHMCEKKRWEQCCAEQTAYFPPTFVQDGRFTHATAVIDRLLETANHFYTLSKDDWICLQINPQKLLQLGIPMVMEEAKAVGNIGTKTIQEWQDWQCPHIYGGIPTTVDGVVTNVYDMKRNKDNGSFLGIVGIISDSTD